MKAFKRLATNYLHVNSDDPPALKEWLEDNVDLPLAQQFEEELYSIVNDGAMTAEEYADITEHEFDSEEDFQTYVETLWNYLFEDGPQP